MGLNAALRSLYRLYAAKTLELIRVVRCISGWGKRLLHIWFGPEE